MSLKKDCILIAEAGNAKKPVWDYYYQKCMKAKKEAKVAEKEKTREAKSEKRRAAAKRDPSGETKEGRLVKLLSGKESFTLAEIMAETGFAQASAKMYTSQDYLDRKNKPYRVITFQKGGKEAYRFEAKK